MVNEIKVSFKDLAKWLDQKLEKPNWNLSFHTNKGNFILGLSKDILFTTEELTQNVKEFLEEQGQNYSSLKYNSEKSDGLYLVFDGKYDVLKEPLEIFLEREMCGKSKKTKEVLMIVKEQFFGKNFIKKLPVESLLNFSKGDVINWPGIGKGGHKILVALLEVHDIDTKKYRINS